MIRTRVRGSTRISALEGVSEKDSVQIARNPSSQGASRAIREKSARPALSATTRPRVSRIRGPTPGVRRRTRWRIRQRIGGEP